MGRKNGMMPFPEPKTRVLIALLLIILPWMAAGAAHHGNDVRARMLEILNQVTSLVKQNYYDPALKNIDWKAAVGVARKRIQNADNEGDMVAAISGLLVRLNDSHTYFVPPQRLQPVIFGFEAKAFGNDVLVYEVMPGGPAEEAGLHLGDKIVAVEGFAANRELIDEEMRYFQYLDPRLTMDLQVVRNGRPVEEYVIKGKQPATSSKDFARSYEEYKDQRVKENRRITVKEEEKGIAYLKFPTFLIPPSAADSLLKETRSARALILDLRDDGGGRDDTLQEMASHFFGEPTEVMLAVGRYKKEELVAKPKRPQFAGPLFLLVDSHSASASEVLARVLQLHKRAIIIGDVTAGKVNLAHWFGGVGGAIYMIPFGMSLTVARIVMPDGLELENRGVTPDVSCIPSEKELQNSDDVCLQKALALARQAISNPGVAALPQQTASPH